MESKLETRIIESLFDGKLPCPSAFKLAKELRIAPKDVGDAVDNMGIKICSCQLGCFK